MISKVFCLLGLISMLIQGREASIVETIRETSVTFGKEGLLKCGYERKAYAVYWRFVSDPSSRDLLVVLDQYDQVGERYGPGYEGGRYNITNDYSLLIHDVRVEDEGRYICEVADFEKGQRFRSYTNVKVTVQAIRPHVRVHQCERNTSVSVNVTDNSKASCMIQIRHNQRHVQLDCFVEGAKPQVHMIWVDNTTLQDLVYGTSFITTHGKREGTVDQKLTVILQVSEFQSEQEYYFTCIAEGPAVGGIASVTVGINKVHPRVSTSAIAPTIAPAIAPAVATALVSSLVVLVVLEVVLISVLLWKKYKRPQHRKDDDRQMDIQTITPLNDDPYMDIETCTPSDNDLQTDIETSTLINNDLQTDIETSTLINNDLQTDIETSTLIKERVPDKRQLLLDKRLKIKEFSPKILTMANKDNHVNLGVFGVAKDGKSSFINSLIFSLEGNYPVEADSGATTSRGRDSTQQREKIKLTDHIHILNYKEMVQYNRTTRTEIFSRIKGQSIKIHCPIFIYDSGNRKGRYAEFMKLLSGEVCSHFGRGLMLVIPNKNDLDGDDAAIKAEMIETIGIPEDHVWIFENYTQESHEEDVERSIQFLDFILYCITLAKENQQFRNTQEKKEWSNFF